MHLVRSLIWHRTKDWTAFLRNFLCRAGEIRLARSTNLAAYKYPSTGRLQTAQKLGLLKLITAAMKLSISSSMIALVIAAATHAYAAVVETAGAPAKVRGRPPC
jgi:hypothetical protein